MVKMTTKILVCCHKADLMAKQTPFMPIHVGKATSSQVIEGAQADNEGENISDKNFSYCELTGLYWAWKNLKDVDVIGLSHYRRYFDFSGIGRKHFAHTAIPTSEFDENKLQIPQLILEKVTKDGSIVVAKPEVYNMTLMQNYCCWHVSDDFRILEYVFYKTQPIEMQRAFFKIIRQGIEVVHFNMFIMRWSDFDEYCSWLFPILEEVERVTKIDAYRPFQKRIYGYMAERLFNVWLYTKKKHLIHKPILFYTDDKFEYSHENWLKYKFRNSCYHFANMLTRPKNFHEYETAEEILPYYLKDILD